MHDRDGERQPLANAERQLATRADRDSGRGRSCSTSSAMRDRACSRRQVEKPGVQIEVLPGGELGVERKRLRHIADAGAIEVGGVDRLPSRKASPSVAGSSPVSIFIVVVLPQPFGPRKPKISPRSMVKLT